MKISDQVTNILKASRAARNSDKELLLIYLQKSGMDLDQRQIELFRKMPSMETLRRTRQSIQEQGHYKADPKVIDQRFEKYKQMRGGYPAERVLHDQSGNEYNIPGGWL